MVHQPFILFYKKKRAAFFKSCHKRQRKSLGMFHIEGGKRDMTTRPNTSSMIGSWGKRGKVLWWPLVAQQLAQLIKLKSKW